LSLLYFAVCTFELDFGLLRRRINLRDPSSGCLKGCFLLRAVELEDWLTRFDLVPAIHINLFHATASFRKQRHRSKK
jgi:hypothetical protein